MKMAYLKSALKLKDDSPSYTEQKKKQPPKVRIVKKEKVPKKEKSPETKPVPEKLSPTVKSAPPVQIDNVSKKTVNIPNITDLKNKTKATIETVEELDTTKKTIPAIERKNNFSLDQLRIEWENFANLLKEGNKDNEHNLMMQKFELKENYKIVIHITNSIEQDILQRFKTDLLGHLKEKLNNDLITIDTGLKKVEKSEKIYTNTDKFNHLAKKNPNLIKLKNIFGLDTEF
jgi:DNA polymerase-3 subunit gamma/tau